ncbi:MAG: NnrU family protein [Steroidobacteraceae bacterium]
MGKLVLGLVVFFGGHSISLLALGWRDRMAKRLGVRAWQTVYTILALLGFYLLVAGYGAARPLAAVLYAPPPWLHYVAAVLMLPAFPLAFASVLRGRIQARAEHPLLLATMLWAVAHLLTNGSAADVLLFGAFLAWAVAVSLSLARRPARRMLALSPSMTNDVIAVVGGLALYAAFILGLHARWIGVPVLGVSL